jgi:hypothetical protein
MWVPLLLVGAAIAGGIIIASKMSKESESGPKAGPPPGTPEVPPPPPGVINISTSDVFTLTGDASIRELVWIKVFAMNPEHPDRTYTDLKSFPSVALAREYYDGMLAFFDQYNTWWSCPDGIVWLEMWGFGLEEAMPHTFDYDSFKCGEEMRVLSLGGSSSAPPAPPFAVGEVQTKPLYLVTLAVSSTGIQESFTFASDAEAEIYYRLLKAFFDQSVMRQAYTSPVGSIVLLKYGTQPSISRAAIYDNNGLIAEEP